MFICPTCSVRLTKLQGERGVFWRCPSCDGRSATVALLRKNVPRNVVNSLWQNARSGNHPRKRPCPACSKRMAEVPACTTCATQHLDVCTLCQFIWFDPGEYDALPVVPASPTVKRTLPGKADERLALLELDAIRDRARSGNWDTDTPEHWWQWIVGLLGMPLEHDVEPTTHTPLVTWSLSILIAVVSVMAFFDLETVVQGLGLIPARALRYGGLTFLTSTFLHGGIMHLVGNLYFFLVFGDNVEDWLGKARFLLLLGLSCLAGDLLHIACNAGSLTPCIGASGAISGVIAYYALKFPRARLGLLFRVFIYFRWISMPAYGMFILWMAIQVFGTWAQLSGISNVSSLAHLGGAGTGFLFWLVTRKK